MKLVLIILSHLVYIFDEEYYTMPTLTISNTSKRKGNEEVSLALKRARREVISDLATKIINGDKKAMANKYHIYPWLTRDMINGCVRRLRKNGKTCGLVGSVYTSQDSEVGDELNKGGRPKGSTTVSKLDIKQKIEAAKNEIVILYKASKDKQVGRLKMGTYQIIHNAVFHELGIPVNNKTTISYECIRKRIFRNNLSVDAHRNNKFPMAPIEPILLQITLWKQSAGQPITPTEGLSLANSLIDGKQAQADLKLLQTQKRATPTGLLSKRYWLQFIKRHKNELDVATGYNVSSTRTEWVTYANIEKMYHLVYTQMVNAGVARWLPDSEQYYVNDEGEKVESALDSVGLKVEVEITHPEWILFGDEVGTDISQKDDGNVGGQKFVSKKGSRANIKSSHKDGRFTLIGLTAATGDPVMCIMIFAAEELTFEQRMGSDIRVPFDNTKTVRENSGPGKRFPGGPTCMFRGVSVPTLVTCSPKGSITSGILTAAFERLDELGVYKRTTTLTPFALFDAHDSRLQVPFLRYINTPPH